MLQFASLESRRGLVYISESALKSAQLVHRFNWMAAWLFPIPISGVAPLLPRQPKVTPRFHDRMSLDLPPKHPDLTQLTRTAIFPRLDFDGTPIHFSEYICPLDLPNRSIFPLSFDGPAPMPLQKGSCRRA